MVQNLLRNNQNKFSELVLSYNFQERICRAGVDNLLHQTFDEIPDSLLRCVDMPPPHLHVTGFGQQNSRT